MKKAYRILIYLLIVFALAVALWFFYGRGNPDALWQIVNQQCVPNQQKNKDPSPCVKVDLAERYVLFKDSKGHFHDLTIPTDKVSGIESPILQTEKTPSYFSLAWNNREHLSTEVGKPLKDQWVSLAINSEYGRSQNQLHIHVSCLRQDVYNALGERAQFISQNWQTLPGKLVGHQYLARKLAGTVLAKENPFHLLQSYVREHGDSISNYGLALAVDQQGEMILLATRLDLMRFNFGSAGEIQDYQCAVAGN